METKKVWVITKIEFYDGEFEIKQEIESDRNNAECRFGERIDDVGEYIESNGIDGIVDENCDADNLYYEMRYNDDFALVFGKEFEV